jgi:hypothetical protein
MHFLDTGEWWASECWRNAHSAVVGAHELVEQALVQATADISPEKIDYGEDYDAYGDAYYHLVDEPASVLRGGLLCQVFGSFEHNLLVLCAEATLTIMKTEYDRHADGPGDIAKKRIKSLGMLAKTEFLSAAHEFSQLQQIRNIVTHASGQPPNAEEKPREAEAIANWIKDHRSLASDRGGEIQLGPGFVPHVTNYLDGLFKKIALVLAENPAAIAAREEHERTQPKWEWWQEVP